MADTAISWTDVVWNPTVGCTRVSAGCDHCYIERQTPMRVAGRRFDGPNIGARTGVTLHPERLTKPLSWRHPRKVFVNSMSDLFHDEIPDDYIAKVFGVMAAAPQHTFQVLTKRHGRMRALLNNADWRSQVFLRESVIDISGPPRDLPTWPLHNVWLGVSVENQKAADLRIPALLGTPAAVRFLSCEPLIGPVDLTEHFRTDVYRCYCGAWELYGDVHRRCAKCGRPWKTPGATGLDWVIVGGESGTEFRPMDLPWLTNIVDQAQAADVPVWVKQDSGPKPGKQGRIADGYWVHEFPAVAS